MEPSADIVVSVWPSEFLFASTVYIRLDVSGMALRWGELSAEISCGTASALGMEKLPLRVYLWESESAGESGTDGDARPEHDGVRKSSRVATVSDMNVRKTFFIVNSFL